MENNFDMHKSFLFVSPLNSSAVYCESSGDDPNGEKRCIVSQNGNENASTIFLIKFQIFRFVENLYECWGSHDTYDGMVSNA